MSLDKEYSVKSLEKLKSAELRKIVIELQENQKLEKQSSMKQSLIQKEMIVNFGNLLKEQESLIASLRQEISDSHLKQKHLNELVSLLQKQLAEHDNKNNQLHPTNNVNHNGAQQQQQILRSPLSIAFQSCEDNNSNSNNHPSKLLTTATNTHTSVTSDCSSRNSNGAYITGNSPTPTSFQTPNSNVNTSNCIVNFTGRATLDQSEVITERMDESEISMNLESDSLSLSTSQTVEEVVIPATVDNSSSNVGAQRCNSKIIKQMREDLKEKSHRLMQSIQSSQFVIHPHAAHNQDYLQQQQQQLPPRCTNAAQIAACIAAEELMGNNSTRNSLQNRGVYAYSVQNSVIESTSTSPTPKNSAKSSSTCSSPSSKENSTQQQQQTFEFIAFSQALQNKNFKASTSNPPVTTTATTIPPQQPAVKFLGQSTNMFVSQRRVTNTSFPQSNVNSIIINQESEQEVVLPPNQVIKANAAIELPSSTQQSPPISLPQSSQAPEQQQLNLPSPAVIPEDIGSVLFEDFFIVGPSKQALHQLLTNSSSLTSSTSSLLAGSSSQQFSEDNQGTTVPPAIWAVLREENVRNEEAISQRDMVKNFCYPYDVNVKRQPCPMLEHGIPDEFLNQLIFKAQASSTDSYVIVMHGRKDYTVSMSAYPQTLAAANPNISLYCVCYTLENFLDDPRKDVNGESETGATCVYLAPVTFCFLTYYPFISYFLKIADQIANQLKQLRSLQYLSIFNQNQGDLRQSVGLDLQNDLNNFWSDKMKPLRENLLQLRRSPPLHGTTISLTISQEDTLNNSRSESHSSSSQTQQQQQLECVSYKVPMKQDLNLLETEWGASIAMSILSLEDFLFVLTSVTLDQSVVFFSSSLQKLTSTLLTFYSVMKPFTYVFPAIFSLPMLIQDMLDSPVPILAGINQSIRYKKLLETEGGFSFRDKVVVDLDQAEIICENSNIKSHIVTSMLRFDGNQKLIEDYFIVNAKHSRFLNIFKRKKPQMVAATTTSLIDSYNEFHNSSSQNKKRSSSGNQKTIRMSEIKPEQHDAALRVVSTIRNAIHAYFLSHFPDQNEFRIRGFDIEKLSKKIVKKARKDKEFIEKFVKTLMFTTFAEQYYKTD